MDLIICNIYPIILRLIKLNCFLFWEEITKWDRKPDWTVGTIETIEWILHLLFEVFSILWFGIFAAHKFVAYISHKDSTIHIYNLKSKDKRCWSVDGCYCRFTFSFPFYHLSSPPPSSLLPLLLSSPRPSFHPCLCPSCLSSFHPCPFHPCPHHPQAPCPGGRATW